MKQQDYLNKKVIISVETLRGLKTYIGLCKEVIYLGKDILGVDVYNYTIEETDTKQIFCFSTNQIKMLGLWVK
jgi:hypothetical protein